MMGEWMVMQEALFYELSLERHVPAGHLVRAIDRFVDLAGIARTSRKAMPAHLRRRHRCSRRECERPMIRIDGDHHEAAAATQMTLSARDVLRP